MLKFGNKEFRNIQEQVEKNAKDIEELKEQGVPGSGDNGLPTDKPTDDGQILIGYTDGSVEWSTETIREFQHELVSGSNIKTINGNSILGSGNLQIGEGGTVTEDHVIEFDYISAASNDPTIVDTNTMNKLKDSNTIIKYNNNNYYYAEYLESLQIILYKTPVHMAVNKVKGYAGIDYGEIHVRLAADNFGPAGLWYMIETSLNMPQTLGTEYTVDGKYIWVANKNGSETTSSWERYTTGSGGEITEDHLVEFATLTTSQYSPTSVDAATLEKLKDPSTVIKYDDKIYYYDNINTTTVQTIITYTTQTLIYNDENKGEATLSNRRIGVRTATTSENLPVGVWYNLPVTVNEIPSGLGINYTEDGDYIFVANKSGALRTSAWQKFNPGTGSSTDLSNYYTKSETDDQFVTKTVFNTTTMGINSVLDEIPDTYATNAGLAGLEVNVMREISSLDGRVDALEAGGGSGTGGNFAPQGSVTDNGQFLVGNINGTYEWSTQTLPEIYNATEEAKTTANEAKTITVGFSENLSNLQLSIDATDEDVAALDTRVTTLENSGGSGGGTAGAVSYLEEQNLTTTQKNQAKDNLSLPYADIIPTTYFTNQSANATSSQRGAYIYASNQPSIKDLASAAIGTTFSITVKNSSSNPTLTETVDCIKTSLSNYDVLTDTTNFLYLSNDSGTVNTSGMDVMKKTGTENSGYGSTVYVDLVVNVSSWVNKLPEDAIDSTLLSGITFDNRSYTMTFVTKSDSSSYSIASDNVVIGNKNNIPSGNNSYYFGYENRGVQNNSPNFIIGNNNRAGYYEYGDYASGSAPTKNMFMLGRYLKPSQNTGYASIVVGRYNEKTSKYIPYDNATTYNTGDCVTARQTNYESAVYRCLQDGVKGKSIPSSTTSNDYWEYVDDGKSSEYVFTVGNGVPSARSNAFTIDTLGNVVAAGTVSPTGADYAEYFEFEDGNTNNEDRMGLLVELVNGKIKLANGTDILGATSASKGVIGDAEEMNWHGKYERDELGRLVFETVEVEREVINEETGETEIVKELVTTKKISKDYDPNRPYQPRSSRKEWYPVGLLGKVLVRQDGTLSVGDYVASINGIATKANEKTNIRVLEVISENIVKILIK